MVGVNHNLPVKYGRSFCRSLLRWRGSIWKSVWKELILWLIAYYVIRVILMYAVPSSFHKSAKNVVELFDKYLTRIPLEFLLGFFVTTIVTRWWNQTLLISAPTAMMGTIAGYVHGLDDESRYIRHTIARYLVLSYALGYRTISTKLKRVFSDNEAFVEIGLVTREESEIVKSAPTPIQYEIPLGWILELVRTKVGCQTSIFDQINLHRRNMTILAKYDNILMPLVYTQTVTFIVYGYFAFALIGHQFLESTVDVVVPVFTILRFIGYMGWLKVAEELAKPWGDDDADIDLCVKLATFSDIAFTIADFAPDRRPRWLPEEEEDPVDKGVDKRVAKMFRDNTTKYSRLGQNLISCLRAILVCNKREDAESEISYGI